MTDSVLDVILLLPATIIFGPPLLYFVLVAIPIGLFAARDFSGPIIFLQILFITIGSLTGLVSSWFIKIRNLDRAPQKIWIRILASGGLVLGLVSGLFELLWLFLQKNNGFAADLFLTVVVLPAVFVGVRQLVRLNSY